MFFFRDKLRSVRWLLAEVLVVVVGILIAFQIDEWKTEREERRQEIASLEAILGDLELGAEEFQAYLDVTEAVVDRLTLIVELLDEEEVPPDERGIDPAVRIVDVTQPPRDYLWRPTASAFESLRDSGNLNLISDSQLRSELVNYFDTVEPFFLDMRQAASDARSRYIEILDEDFERYFEPRSGPVESLKFATSRRRLRVSPEAWPTDHELRNALFEYGSSLTETRIRAFQAQNLINGLRSNIEDHIESIF